MITSMDDGTKVQDVLSAPKYRGRKDTSTNEKLPLLNSAINCLNPAIVTKAQVQQSPTILQPSCSRCQSLKAGRSLHLTLAYRKCRCHRQFERKIGASKGTGAAVCNLTSSSTGLSPIVQPAPAPLLPQIDPLPSAKKPSQALDIADSAKNKPVDEDSGSAAKLPFIVR